MPDIGALAARHRPAVWRYLRVLGCDESTADDLTQEVFVVVLRRPDFRVGDAAAAFGFLRTTARHLWLKSLRRRLADREVEAADRLWDARCGDGDGNDYTEALRHCVELLPQRSRDLLAATYGERASRSVSAGLFGMTAHGVKSALRRLRTALHDCIERRLKEGER
ncbi:MAG: sigma factor [Planctomycetota bacterium]